MSARGNCSSRNGPCTGRISKRQSSQVRTLVDPGSEVTCISLSLAKLLNLKIYGKSTTIVGVGKLSSCASRHSTLYIRSRLNHDVVYNAQGLVLDDVTSYSPRCSAEVSSWISCSSLVLVDPEFSVHHPTEILLEIDVYRFIIQS